MSNKNPVLVISDRYGQVGLPMDSEAEAIEAQQIHEYRWGVVCWLMRPENLVDAYHAGTNAAIGLRKGDVWIGAFGEAEKAGYKQSAVSFNVFVSGFLDVVKARWPRGVIVDTEFSTIREESE